MDQIRTRDSHKRCPLYHPSLILNYGMSFHASIDLIFLVPPVPDAYIDIGAEVHFLVSPRDVTHFCALSRMKESLMYRFM
jgi:hypothetical protein